MYYKSTYNTFMDLFRFLLIANIKDSSYKGTDLGRTICRTIVLYAILTAVYMES